MSDSDPHVDAAGTWLDGRSSRPQPVRLRLSDDGRRLLLWSSLPPDPARPPLPLADWPISAVRPSARLAGVPRRLELADGSVVETFDDDWVDRRWPRAHRLQAGVHWLEGRWRWVIGLGVAAVCTAVLLLQFGLPWLIARVADRVPWSLERRLGEQTLELLGEFGMGPSALPAERQRHLRALFAGLCQQLPPGPACRLHFRAAEMANAFALPGGEVVFTDRLVELLANDAEFIAIAGHELGHVEGRHVLRSQIASASLLMLLSAAVGDVSLVAFGGGFTSLDTLLAAHSREQEQAADAYAFAVLRAQGHSPAAFASAIERLQQAAPGRFDATADYLRSHPQTADRAAAARRAAAATSVD